METYKETRNIVKIGDKNSQEFLTMRKLRQRYPLSLTLFNIHVFERRDGEGENR